MNAMEGLSALSIAAFLLACLSPFAGPMAFLPAILCGHLALRERKREPGLQGYRFGFAGLIVGYAVGLNISQHSLVYLAPCRELVAARPPFRRDRPINRARLAIGCASTRALRYSASLRCLLLVSWWLIGFWLLLAGRDPSEAGILRCC